MSETRATLYAQARDFRRSGHHKELHRLLEHDPEFKARWDRLKVPPPEVGAGRDRTEGGHTAAGASVESPAPTTREGSGPDADTAESMHADPQRSAGEVADPSADPTPTSSEARA